jgi:hypothetical protein
VPDKGQNGFILLATNQVCSGPEGAKLPHSGLNTKSEAGGKSKMQKKEAQKPLLV